MVPAKIPPNIQHPTPTMLYKFKSKTTGDVIMLEPNGRQVLTIMGKSDADQLVKGILEPADMAGAIAALERAIADEDAAKKAATEAGRASDGATDGSGVLSVVSLRQRATPLLDMLRRCQAAKTPIVWGV